MGLSRIFAGREGHWQTFRRLFGRAMKHAVAAGALLVIFGASAPVAAQPAGWTSAVPISITENSATASTGYQMRLVLDTSTMAPNAADLRFGANAAGTTLLDYWIESGAGTASTVVWVRLPALAASGTLTIYMFSGNPSATSASTLNVFDYTDVNANSATNQVATGGSGGAPNSQRGFRFTPNEDVLLTQFGKREPDGTTRYVTLFNFATQAIIAQQQVSGPAATYSYADAAQPIWLTAGTQYIVTLYQGATDGYYFGTSSQINSKLTYGDMRFCNSCTENTFPTSALPNIHYGYPDFQFRTKQTLSPAPTYVVNVRTIGGTVTGLSGSGLVLSLSAGDTQTLSVSANGSFTFAQSVSNAQSYAVTVQTQPSGPTQTCTVTNGTGAAAPTNVTDVAVSCTTNTYTIGGTVSGLAGTGLVLSLNAGAQTVSVTANGAFNFPTAIASGSTYAVTVQSQPSAPTQTCSLTNASGSVSSSNVTNIGVTCTTNTYTVGGAVSGLSGSGLVLSLNAGAQTLTVAANGAFTFPTALASGSNYTVTVQTQPSGPAQSCSVTNGNGTVGASNVTNVTVTCATNTYTVGGSVTGLAGSGLVLSLNAGAQTLPVAANGTFTFPTALASGSSYAVTVQTQPASPTQTCAVSNGSGTVVATSITNIAVNCTTNTYTVGGTVSGLAGTGLVLSLNAGAQTLPIAANGAFTFPTALASGASYAVTVQTQPAGPVQSCVVSNGTGTVGGANITSVSVACSTTQRTISVVSPGSSFTATPPVPASVTDGTVLSFAITLTGGARLQSVTGCGGSLSGNVYTTAPITANCTIVIASQVVEVPALNAMLLWLLAAAVVGTVLLHRRHI